MSLAELGPDLATAAEALDADTVELRRAIHHDPELGLHLPETQTKITEALTGLGLDITLGESTTSVVADLDSGKPGPTVLLRGDMDALPLQEDYPSDFKSKHDGRMHACGHDTHVAMLVSAAKLLADSKDSFTGKIRFMFQPGEEGFHGAKFMIEEGVLDGVDRAFAIHAFTNMPSGMITTKDGAIMASADRFEITIHGEGGHASAPHQCADPIPAMASTITGLHTMVGRSIEATQSGLVTVAHVEAGTTNNIIPHQAWMEGTTRPRRAHPRDPPEQHQPSRRRQRRRPWLHLHHQRHAGYPVTINHPGQQELVAQVTNEIMGSGTFRRCPTRDGRRGLQLCPSTRAGLDGLPRRMSRRRTLVDGGAEPLEPHASERGRHAQRRRPLRRNGARG